MTPYKFGVHVAEKIAEQTQSGTMSLSQPGMSSAQPNTTVTGSGMGLGGPQGAAKNMTPGSVMLDSWRGVKNTAGNAGMAALQSPAGQGFFRGLGAAGKVYENNVSPGMRQTFKDMGNNSVRGGMGVLNTAAGLAGTIGAAGLGGASMAWNALTPKSMNTSQGWLDGLSGAADASVNFMANGARDVYGAFGGDTNYDKSHAWNQLEAGFNNPNVDPTTRELASDAAHIGTAAGQLGTTMANPGAAIGGVTRLNSAAQAARWADRASNAFSFATGMPEAGIQYNNAVTAAGQ